MIININDSTNDKINMDNKRELLELYPWVILNLNEIGDRIAEAFFDSEYQVSQEFLDEEINDFLSNIHEKIIEKAIQKLEENNIDVI